MKTPVFLGLMSGTSLDGLDIAACRFEYSDGRWAYELIKTATIEYTRQWKVDLMRAPELGGVELIALHHRYGRWLGDQCRRWSQGSMMEVEAICSHGHTIFHDPKLGYTFQLGELGQLAAASGMQVVGDFRTIDVARGGQGAPLVPVGDKLLFGEYEVCMNIGGFVNVSYDIGGWRQAFDMCPANILFNRWARNLGYDYDRDGHLARSGQVLQPVLDRWNASDYYSQPPPKSLGREWLQENLLAGIPEGSRHEDLDLLRTAVEHCAQQIGRQWSQNDLPRGRVLCTGGGTLNGFVVERIREVLAECEIVIPSRDVIDYKEALIFAFLGKLRLSRKPNIYSSCTGARSQSISGMVVLP